MVHQNQGTHDQHRTLSRPASNGDCGGGAAISAGLGLEVDSLARGGGGLRGGGCAEVESSLSMLVIA